MAKINLGKLGETDFVRWCTQTGLITNSSNEEDVAGWDYLVEFPTTYSASTPKDRTALPFECKVQVKATQRKDKCLGIKLSVLQRLVNYNYPAFILFLEYTSQTQPTIEKAYLVHIDDKLIERTLKKLRENDLLEKPKELNKVKISVTYNENHRLPNLSGDALKLSIESFTGTCVDTYIKEKQSLRNNIGYKDGGITMTCTFGKHSFNKQHFIEMSLGLRESIDVDRFIVKDERFNLANDKFIMSQSESGKITIHNESSKCKVRIKTSKYSPAITFDTELITLPINPVLHKDEKVLLLKTKLFTFVLEGLKPENTQKIIFTLDNPCKLDEVLSVLKVFSVTNSGLIMEIEGLHKKTIKLDIALNTPKPYKTKFIQGLENIINTFEIDRASETNFNHIAHQEDHIVLLDNLLKNNISNGYIDTKEPIPNDPNQFIFLETMFINLGEVIVGGLFGLHASKESANKFKIYRAELLQPICSYESISENELSILFEETKARFDDDDILLVTRK
ncbi:hypothetical protein [Vibrio cholerae]|uniref:hypothetical protein n=1 Tax=Vibrio cholerae TaxID=666 RepID=UPI0010FF5C48|nr:hypothetical protein [Vibrio cholerae]TLE17683.1 hypothetical protein D2924_17800 [Vibrio cholerae]TLE36879.1 hypothetical protein D2925_03155 [Vibrio cholerae]TQP95782.1 hypothetical protein FLL77_14825 [Vibrio cholerae]